MTIEEFDELLKQTSDFDLIVMFEKQIRDLSRSGGKTFNMTVPPKVEDSDMVMSEVLRRFKKAIR